VCRHWAATKAPKVNACGASNNFGLGHHWWRGLKILEGTGRAVFAGGRTEGAYKRGVIDVNRGDASVWQ